MLLLDRRPRSDVGKMCGMKGSKYFFLHNHWKYA